MGNLSLTSGEWRGMKFFAAEGKKRILCRIYNPAKQLQKPEDYIDNDGSLAFFLFFIENMYFLDAETLPEQGFIGQIYILSFNLFKWDFIV